MLFTSAHKFIYGLKIYIKTEPFQLFIVSLIYYILVMPKKMETVKTVGLCV